MESTWRSLGIWCMFVAAIAGSAGFLGSSGSAVLAAGFATLGLACLLRKSDEIIVGKGALAAWFALSLLALATVDVIIEEL